MGNVFGGTTGLSIITLAAFVVAAILAILADNKIKGIPTYNSDTNLQNAHNNLTVAIILAFVAVGLALILMLRYIAHAFKFLDNSAWYTILWILTMAAALISIIYMGLALRKINSITNDNNAYGYLLWALIIGAIGIVVLAFSELWVVTHHANKTTKTSQTKKTTGVLVSTEDGNDNDVGNPPDNEAEKTREL